MDAERLIAEKYKGLRPVLNEQSRRRWAAAEALALGRGGISAVARATGLSRPTIRAGIGEIQYPFWGGMFHRREPLGEVKLPTVYHWGEHDGVLPV